MATRNLLALLCLYFAACASTTLADIPPPAAYPKGVRILDLAKNENLKASFDAARGKWLLEGRGSRVLLFTGTDITVVNGQRVQGMGSICGSGTEGYLSADDAAKIRAALHAAPPPKPAPPPPPPAAVAKKDPGPVEPFPGVKVPLGRKWKYIVIHHSATAEGSAATFHKFHQKVRGWDGLGYHFVVGNGQGSANGQVEVGYRWTRQQHGAHAGRPPDGSNTMNETGIGICLVGDFNRTAPTAAQRRSLHELVDFLTAWCSIPPENVLMHKDIRGTDCPGRRFPTAEFSNSRLKAKR